jgi:hypothetical protein
MYNNDVKINNSNIKYNNSINNNDNNSNDKVFDGFDMSKLLEAVETDTEKTDYLLNLTTLKIQELNLNILKELKLKKKETLALLKKLNGYKYVDELKELKYGRFIRWIPISDPEYLHLIKGGVICEVKVRDDGIHIIYKNFMHMHFQFKMDECLIFQKLSSQELVLLSALDHISK